MAPSWPPLVLAALLLAAALAPHGSGLGLFPPGLPEKLLPATPGVSAWFGRTVVLDGPTMAIGTLGGFGGGSVEVHRRDSAGDWQPEAELWAPYGDLGGVFRGSIAVEGDLLALGAVVPGTWSLDGAVHLYQRVAGAWTRVATVAPPGQDRFDNFGSAVALKGDTLVAAAITERTGGAVTGAVHVYRATAGTWTHEARLLGLDTGPHEQYGQTVALHGDTLLVGAPQHDLPLDAAGAVYVFERSGAGWAQTAKVQPGDLSTNANFGADLDLDGDTAVVAAPHQHSGPGNPEGAAYVLARTGGTWELSARLGPLHPPGHGDDFAESVALDGDVAVVGTTAFYDSISAAGAAYVFGRTPAGWLPTGLQLTPPASLVGNILGGDDAFGLEVEVHGDTLAVGAPLDDAAAADAGAVHLYRGFRGAS